METEAGNDGQACCSSGDIPPPWAEYREHPHSMRWRMGGGESFMELWREWWSRQGFTLDQKIGYFRKWPPPHCWLAFLIEAVWDIDPFEEEGNLPHYFQLADGLGFGNQQDYERDLDDPKWLGENP